MKSLLTLTLILLACILYGQNMQGPYTVGGAAANFDDLDNAITALHAASITGNVYLYLNPGTYTGPYIIENLDMAGHTLYISSGTYSSDEVIFTNHAATSQDNYIILIKNSSNIRIDDFDFAPTGQYSRSIMVSGDSNDISITNNRFFNTSGTSTSNNESIYFVNESANDADNVVIQFNQFFAPGYHIVVNSTNSNNRFSEFDIIANIHEGGYCAISLTRVGDLTLESNTINGANTGISATSLNGDLLVKNNRINAWANGMNFSGCDVSTSGDTPNVYNNIIRANGNNWYGGNGNVDASGLTLNSCEDIYAAHNSVEITSPTTGSYALTLSGSNNRLMKNHFVNMGTGFAVYFSNVEGPAVTRNIVGFNNLYTRGSYLGKQSNTTYKEINELNPLFGSPNTDYNPFFEDVHLISHAPSMDNYGPYVNIAVDFGGNPRSSSSPDLGAWEYTSDPTLSPMSGIYTIGASGDFQSVNSFATALAFRGVANPVIGSLIDPAFDEQVVFDRIPGSAINHQVTLSSMTPEYPTISYSGQTSASNPVLSLYRSSYLNFNQISFSASSQDYSRIASINGYVHDVTFMWCNFTAPTGLADSYNRISMVCDDSAITENLKLVACLFDGNARGASLRGYDLQVSATSFRNQLMGLALNQAYDPYIADCRFEGIGSYAIQINGIQDGDIVRNEVFGSSYGITVANPIVGGGRSLIANNLIKIEGQSANTGLWIGGNGFDVLNNSVMINGRKTANAFYSYELPSEIDIVNNIFVSIAGLAMDIGYYTANSSQIIDYNSYYTEGNHLVKMGSTTFDDLAALQAAHPGINVHSVGYNPLWDEDMHVHSQYLRGIAQVRDEFDDDINEIYRGEAWDIGAEQQTLPSDLSPLAGTYSVGSPQADYPTMDECLWALQYHGINDHVIFHLEPGTYAGGYTLKEYPKSAANLGVVFSTENFGSITINPESDVMDNNYFVRTLGASNVSFMTMSLSSAAPGRNTHIFIVEGRSKKTVFRYLNITLPTSSSIAIGTRTGLGEDLWIGECNFYGTGYGVVVTGDSQDGTQFKEVVITQNTFSGPTHPITVSRTDDLTISGNVIGSFARAIYLNRLGGENSILRNRITASGNYSATMVEINSVNGSSEHPVTLVENIIHLNNSTTYGNGVLIFNSSWLKLLHNTITVENNNDMGYALGVSTLSNSELRNNVFSAPKNGYAVEASNLDAVTWDCNAYYASGTNTGKYNNVAYPPQILIPQKYGDTLGVYADAMTDDSGYNTCAYLHGRAALSSLSTDIDSQPWIDGADIGANLIANPAAPIASSFIVGGIGEYPDLTTAVYELKRRGIANDITMLVSPGVYQEQLELSYIPGSIDDNSLRILGSSEAPVTVTFSATDFADNYILKIRNTRNLSLENLSFTVPGNVYGRMLQMETYNEGLSISGCSFIGAGGSNNNAAAVYTPNSLARSFSFTDNLVQNTGHGIYMYDTATQSDFLIQGNEISGVDTGIELNFASAAEISQNGISATNRGVMLSGINTLNLDGNRIYCATGIDNVVISSNNGTSGEQRIVNNFILATRNRGLNLITINNAQVFHNTVVTTGTSGTAAFLLQSGCSGAQIRNNIFHANSGTAAQYAVLTDLAALSTNLYHSASAAPVKLGSTPLADLQEYFAATSDNSSMYGDPLLDTGTYYTRAASPGINHGVDIPGLAYDIEGHLRTLPDIGCYEYVALALATPQNLRISRSDNVTTLSWDEVPDADYYIVYVSDAPDSDTWSQIPSQAPSLVLDSSPAARFYKVSAVNE